MKLLFDFDEVNILLKSNGGTDRSNFFIFVVWSALNVEGWVVVGWGRESCLDQLKFRLCVLGLIRGCTRWVILRYYFLFLI